MEKLLCEYVRDVDTYYENLDIRCGINVEEELIMAGLTVMRYAKDMRPYKRCGEYD